METLSVKLVSSGNSVNCLFPMPWFRPFSWALAGLLLASASLTAADPIADRRAVEQVYYKHRLGTKPPFDETMPTALLGQLVQKEAEKERVLKAVYAVEITDALVEAEVKRIEATSKAPEVLAEIQAALGKDRARFAATVARPIVVERILRARFENDEKLHAATRQSADALRQRLLAAKAKSPDAAVAAAKETKDPVGRELSWSLRPREGAAPTPAISTPSQPTQGSASSKSYSVEATVGRAQVLSPPAAEAGGLDRKMYFEDLDPELQRVLQVQLRAAGDVSAVIESAQGFQVFLTAGRTADELKVWAFALPKRSFDEWLAAQGK